MRWVWILQLVLLWSAGYSQADLIYRDGPLYIYQNKAYSCEEMGEVYDKNQEALKLYRSGRKMKKASKTMRYGGLGLMISGVAIGINGSSSRDRIGKLAIVAGIGFEIFSIFPHAAGAHRLDKAMRTFNYEMIRRKGIKPQMSLSFGMTMNGIELVYSF